MQRRDQLAGARQRDDAVGAAQIELGVQIGQPAQRGVVQHSPGFALQSLEEQATTHPDAAVDPPHRQGDAALGQRLLPGDDVLVHRIDQRAVQIEQQGWLRHR